MAKIEWITASELARRVDKPRQKIQKLINNGTIRRENKKFFNAEKSIAIIKQNELLDNNISGSSGNGKNGGSGQRSITDELAEARLKQLQYKALITELDYKKRAGELGEIAEFIEFGQRVIATATARFRAISPKISPELIGIENPKEIQKILDEAIDEALRELARLTDV